MPMGTSPSRSSCRPSFVGQPLEAGKASAKLEIAVTDTADHKETITKNLPVTAAPILVTAVPESGELVPGLENRIYVVSTYADSTPARCQVLWANAPDHKAQMIRTDEAGFGLFTYRPAQAANLPMMLVAWDEKGQEGQAKITLDSKSKTGDDTVLLRTDRSLYRVGQQAKLEILTTRPSGTVYLDFIKDRQTYLTRSVEVKEGRAADTVTFDPTLAGTVQINAYLIGANGEMMRDRRLVIVDPADDLKVSIRNDAATYLPGGEAQVSFRVTNAAGRGVVSALGVMVVDEAVFALQEMQPGLEKIYFYLEKEIATPRYEIHGWSLDQSMQPEQSRRRAALQRDTAARVLLASAKGVGDDTLQVDTYKRDNKAAAFQLKIGATAGRSLSEGGPGPGPVWPEAPPRHPEDRPEGRGYPAVGQRGAAQAGRCSGPLGQTGEDRGCHLVAKLADVPELCHRFGGHRRKVGHGGRYYLSAPGAAAIVEMEIFADVLDSGATTKWAEPAAAAPLPRSWPR